MPELIVTEKIDGNAVAWRCSDCRQRFSVRGKLTTQQRRRKVTVEFKAHMENCHNAKGFASGMAFSPA
jgi:hypothetical protein